MARRVLFISENAPVPSDRRVWNEARTLHAAGWEVVIVCAQGNGRHTAPFELIDGIEVAARAGVTAIIQPGGSVRDHEVVEAADGAGISMVFTHRRHFRH